MHGEKWPITLVYRFSNSGIITCYWYPYAKRGNMLHVSLRKQYFDAIRAGLKTVEGRLNAAKFKVLSSGMMICFTLSDSHEALYCIIETVTMYKSFEDMLEAEGVGNILPGVTSLEKAIAIYEAFPGYKEGVKDIGALAIRFKLIL
jgi:ASC-1-like (ASCH) protein